MSDYGMGCYACDASIDGADIADVERKAVAANWHIGLLSDAQAYYSCPDCAPCLFSPKPLTPIYSKARK